MKSLVASALKVFKKKTLLIVEDDHTLRKVLFDRMSAEGWRVLESPDGRDGLVSAIKNHPDAILLDLMLPQMDGITLLQELRKDERGKDARVIVMSNLVKGVGLTEKVRMFHVEDHIEKADMSLDALAEKIRKLL